MRFLVGFLCIFLNLFASDAKLKVAVSIEPQAFFVKKIGGDRVEVYVLVPKNKNPENYEPLVSQVKNLKETKLYFGMGLDFETKWKERFLSINPQMDFVDLSHQHNKNFHNRHDSHIWLSVTLAYQQANEIYEYLIKEDRNNKDFYEQNLKDFLNEIRQLDARIKNLFSQQGVQKTFLVYHPAFEFFAEEYGLEELAIEDHHKEAKIKHMQKINQVIKERKLKIVYKQPQFSSKQVELLAKEYHLQVSILDPFVYDWLANMWNIAEQIAYEK
ncbi:MULTISPECIES: metal ABC transporter solute-binding protein, Zn/Mn family [unclassified Helicobacter]|uniref:metal ABC transporter solute-binding protein, Zn/Mn family n=1 Tax=unclassified Helicobacter TaxID=2593540 RepID=UPI000CF13B52|nr:MULTISPECIES: zinc ABC transporter substrate-binding protein [unclassified Helicobacter]